MNRLWAPWRMAYVTGGAVTGSCVFCRAHDAGDDPGQLVLVRRSSAFLMLNAYPYASGHVMAVVNRHVGGVHDVTPEELTDAMALVQAATRALTREYRADGFNIGINQGRVAGAGIEDHLHVHVVPRWGGDTNFMPVVGDAKVLPEALEATYRRLRASLTR